MTTTEATEAIKCQNGHSCDAKDVVSTSTEQSWRNAFEKQTGQTPPDRWPMERIVEAVTYHQTLAC